MTQAEEFALPEEQADVAPLYFSPLGWCCTLKDILSVSSHRRVHGRAA